MNANERFFYQQSIDWQMEQLLKKMRVQQIVKDHNEKMYDRMIEGEIEEAVYGQD